MAASRALLSGGRVDFLLVLLTADDDNMREALMDRDLLDSEV